MDCVIEFFEKEYSGCELLELWYDEEWNEEQDKNTIVLLSDYYAGFVDGMNLSSTYSEWQWWLTRDSEQDDWELETCGYG